MRKGTVMWGKALLCGGKGTAMVVAVPSEA